MIILYHLLWIAAYIFVGVLYYMVTTKFDKDGRDDSVQAIGRFIGAISWPLTIFITIVFYAVFYFIIGCHKLIKWVTNGFLE